MPEETIAEVGIGPSGALYVRPEQQSFPLIYRAAMGIGWEQGAARLSGLTPNERSHAEWFLRIGRAVVAEYGVRLRLRADTIWTNMPENIRVEITIAAEM